MCPPHFFVPPGTNGAPPFGSLERVFSSNFLPTEASAQPRFPLPGCRFFLSLFRGHFASLLFSLFKKRMGLTCVFLTFFLSPPPPKAIGIDSLERYLGAFPYLSSRSRFDFFQGRTLPILFFFKIEGRPCTVLRLDWIVIFSPDLPPPALKWWPLYRVISSLTSSPLLPIKITYFFYP